MPLSEAFNLYSSVLNFLYFGDELGISLLVGLGSIRDAAPSLIWNLSDGSLAYGASRHWRAPRSKAVPRAWGGSIIRCERANIISVHGRRETVLPSSDASHNNIIMKMISRWNSTQYCNQFPVSWVAVMISKAGLFCRCSLRLNRSVQAPTSEFGSTTTSST